MGKLSICRFNWFNLRVSAKHPCAHTGFAGGKSIIIMIIISFCNQMNENHYRRPCPGECQLSLASPLRLVGSSVHLTNLPRFSFCRKSPRPRSRVKVNERSAGPQQMSCVENNILLVADGLSVAKETTLTAQTSAPPSGFDAASCRVYARATGQPGPVCPLSGSVHLTPSLSAGTAVQAAVFCCDVTRCYLVACSNRTAASHLCCAAARQSGC